MIDFVNVVKGSIATDEALSHVIPGLGTPLGSGLELAGRFRERLSLPVFHAARIADVATARYAIAEGLVDMVGMMRAHMADPHIVRKLEAGQVDRIRPCVGVSYCLNRIYVGLDGLCIHNPATGREETIPQLTVPSARSAPDGRGRRGGAGGPGGGPSRGRARPLGSSCSRRPRIRADRSASRHARRRAMRTSSASSTGSSRSAGMPAWRCGSMPWRTWPTSWRWHRTSWSSRPVGSPGCRPWPRATTWS